MKKFKIVLWIIIVAFIALVFFQNKAFFTTKQSIFLNLYVTDPYQSPDIFIAVWFLAVLVAGLLIAYFFALVDKFRAVKLIKGSKAKTDAQEQLIAQLKQKLEIRDEYPPNEAIDTMVVNAAPPVPDNIPANDR